MVRSKNGLDLKNLSGIFLLGLALLSAACGGIPPGGTPNKAVAEESVFPATTPLATEISTFTPMVAPTPQQPTALPSQTVSPVPPTLTQTPLPSPTPGPYTGLDIDELASRTYGGGQLEILEVLDDNSFFTRLLISYPSDGLTIYGFMDLPKVGSAPYPVVIALHGYIEPEIYETIDYTTRYADDFARAGYLVLHPNLRGYPPSDSGPNLFRVGMAVDVLNLIAIVRELGGIPGPLELADRDAIGLWGHSMGGGITTRVITISTHVRAAVLYGAMSGDEQKNFERIFHYFSPGTRGQEELNTPGEVVQRISPINYLDRITAAVSIHHGKEDPDVPLAWSMDLCQRLGDLEKTVECFTYPGQAHTFHGDGDVLFIQRAIDFFNRQLRSQ